MSEQGESLNPFNDYDRRRAEVIRELSPAEHHSGASVLEEHTLASIDEAERHERAFFRDIAARVALATVDLMREKGRSDERIAAHLTAMNQTPEVFVNGVVSEAAV